MALLAPAVVSGSVAFNVVFCFANVTAWAVWLVRAPLTLVLADDVSLGKA